MNKALLLALGSMMIFMTSAQAKDVHGKACAKTEGATVAAGAKKSKLETKNAAATIKTAPAKKATK